MSMLKGREMMEGYAKGWTEKEERKLICIRDKRGEYMRVSFEKNDFDKLRKSIPEILPLMHMAIPVSVNAFVCYFVRRKLQRSLLQGYVTARKPRR